MASADWMNLTSSRTVALKRVRFLAFVGVLVGEFGRMGEVCWESGRALEREDKEWDLFLVPSEFAFAGIGSGK